MISLQNLQQQPWRWPALTSLILLALVFVLEGEFKLSIVTANLAAASFLAMAGLAQMFPVASGEGGIDLSIPFVINFCAFLTVKMVTDDSSSLIPLLGIVIIFSIIVGLVNGIVIVRFQIPPIIGTLAVGFIVLTLVQIISAEGSTRVANRNLIEFTRGSLLGIPTPFYGMLILAVSAAITFKFTKFGRYLLAVGQSRRAAKLSGVNVERTIVGAYVICAVVAGLAGVALVVSVGSADLQLGNPFLLTSVGAVVLGGNRISGGSASVTGTVVGSILLTLLVLAVTVMGLPIEMKHIVTGLVITVVLIATNAPDPHLRISGKRIFARASAKNME